MATISDIKLQKEVDQIAALARLEVEKSHAALDRDAWLGTSEGLDKAVDDLQGEVLRDEPFDSSPPLSPTALDPGTNASIMERAVVDFAIGETDAMLIKRTEASGRRRKAEQALLEDEEVIVGMRITGSAAASSKRSQRGGKRSTSGRPASSRGSTSDSDQPKTLPRPKRKPSVDDKMLQRLQRLEKEEQTMKKEEHAMKAELQRQSEEAAMAQRRAQAETAAARSATAKLASESAEALAAQNSVSLMAGRLREASTQAAVMEAAKLRADSEAAQEISFARAFCTAREENQQLCSHNSEFVEEIAFFRTECAEMRIHRDAEKARVASELSVQSSELAAQRTELAALKARLPEYPILCEKAQEASRLCECLQAFLIKNKNQLVQDSRVTDLDLTGLVGLAEAEICSRQQESEACSRLTARLKQLLEDWLMVNDDGSVCSKVLEVLHVKGDIEAMLDVLEARWAAAILKRDEELAGHNHRAMELARDLSLQRADLIKAKEDAESMALRLELQTSEVTDARDRELYSLGTAALTRLRDTTIDSLRQVALNFHFERSSGEDVVGCSPVRKPLLVTVTSVSSKGLTHAGPFERLCTDAEAVISGEVAALQRTCDAGIELRVALQDGERCALRSELFEAQQITEAVRSAAWTEAAERGALAQRAKALANGYEAEAEAAVDELLAVRRPVQELEVQHQKICAGLAERAAKFELESERLTQVVNETTIWQNEADSAQKAAEAKLLEVQSAARAIVSDQDLCLKDAKVERENALKEIDKLQNLLQKAEQQQFQSANQSVKDEEMRLARERLHAEIQECGQLSKRARVLEAEHFNQTARICAMQAEEGTLEVHVRQVGWARLKLQSEFDEMKMEHADTERQVASLCESLCSNAEWEGSELERERATWQQHRLRQDHDMAALRQQLSDTCRSLVSAKADNDALRQEYKNAERSKYDLSAQMALESNQARQAIQVIETHFVQLREEAQELHDALNRERSAARLSPVQSSNVSVLSELVRSVQDAQGIAKQVRYPASHSSDSSVRSGRHRVDNASLALSDRERINALHAFAPQSPAELAVQRGNKLLPNFGAANADR